MHRRTSADGAPNRSRCHGAAVRVPCALVGRSGDHRPRAVPLWPTCFNVSPLTKPTFWPRDSRSRTLRSPRKTSPSLDSTPGSAMMDAHVLHGRAPRSTFSTGVELHQRARADTQGERDGVRSGILRQVPLFALLDDDELAVLAAQVEIAQFAPRQRIYRIGDPGERAYVMSPGGPGHDHRRRPSGRRRRSSRRAASSSGLRRCSTRRRIRPTPSRSRRRVCLEVDRQRHLGAVAAEAARGDGHAERPRPPVPCDSAAGPHPRRAQPERDHRERGDVRRAHRRRRRRLRRIVDVHHHVPAVLAIYTAINVALGRRPGIRIRSSC